MFAVVDDVAQGTTHPLQVGHSGLDLREAGARDAANRTTVRAVLQFEQFADLLERETEFLRSTDEPQAGRVRRAVATNASETPRRLR